MTIFYVKCLEAIFIVNWRYINKLNETEMLHYLHKKYWWLNSVFSVISFLNEVIVKATALFQSIFFSFPTCRKCS